MNATAEYPPAPANDAVALAEYLERIGFSGTPVAEYATLAQLQRLHLAAIPFENLDAQLGRPPGLERDEIFGKLVTQRRGGWCYEMNGVFGRMLQTIGFDVTRVTGGVMRETHGDSVLGNHLSLIVHLDRDYLVDVGFGGSQLVPLPLEDVSQADGPFRISLGQEPDGYWRFAEEIDGRHFSFDFRPELADEALLAHMNGWLAHAPESPFMKNLVVQRRVGDRQLTLRGRVLKTFDEGGVHTREIVSAEDLVATLRDAFALDAPEAAKLWPAITARHQELFGETAL